MESHFQAAAADDLKTTKLARAQRELEELYMGVPDESVNLTFQHLANVKQQCHLITPPSDDNNNDGSRISTSNKGTLNKLPSLDFHRLMQASRPNQYHQQSLTSSSRDNNKVDSPTSSYNRRDHHIPTIVDSSTSRDSNSDDNNIMMYNSGQYHTNMINSPDPIRHNMKLKQPALGSSGYDNNDLFRMRQQYVAADDRKHDRGVGVARQGIPHTKICAICDTYIYLFRHRCLVCGRVYCRNCVNIGMGEMSEGRKCVECLGRRFSHRYIHRAGKMQGRRWCCCWQSYPHTVKQQELKWAEKGPRMMSRMSVSRYDEDNSSTTPSNGMVDHNNYKSPSYHMSNTPSFVARPPSPSRSSPYLNF